MHHKCDLFVLLLLLICFAHQGADVALLTQHQSGWHDLALWAEIYTVPVDEVGCIAGKGGRTCLLTLVAEGPARSKLQPFRAGHTPARASSAAVSCSDRACSASIGSCSMSCQISLPGEPVDKRASSIYFASLRTRQIFQYLLNSICILMDKFMKKGTTQSQFASLISIETTGALIAFMCF